MSDVLFAYFGSICIFRVQSCYLHSYVLSHLFDFIVYNVCYNVNQNTDFSTHMSIGSYETFCFFYFLETTNLHVLADYCNLSSQSFVYSFGCIKFPCLSQECIDICCLCFQSLLSNLCNVCLEFFVFSNEVSFSIYFYSDSFFGIFCNFQHYDTFCCDSACFFLCSCKTFFSQEFHSLVHITFGSCKSFLTVHHTSAADFS